MMQKYKECPQLRSMRVVLFRLKKQKKNIIRRKKVSLFRLKTAGFGFLWTILLKKRLTAFFLKKQFNFFFFKCEQPKPDNFFKNVVKAESVAAGFFYNFFIFFNFCGYAPALLHFLFFSKLLAKKLFFFKLFFFKLALVRLITLKLHFQRSLLLR